MSRTREERLANDAIEIAINAFRAAYIAAHPEATNGTMVDWIVVAAETLPNMEDPDEDRTAYSVIMPGGGIPWYRAEGLLQAGRKYLGLPEEDE